MRTRIKGTGTKGSMNPETEPDFYAMPPIKPLDQMPPKPPTGNIPTWKVTYTQTVKTKKKPKPAFARRVSVEPQMVVQRAEPPVVQSSRQFINEKIEPSFVQSSEQFNTEKATPSMVQSADDVLPIPRPPSYPKILPLVMPILPKCDTSAIITPPLTPQPDGDLSTSEMPDEWLLSDSSPLDEPISFEGKTFHYLDACSFDCLQEERGNDQSSWGFSLKDSDAFFAGL